MPTHSHLNLTLKINKNEKILWKGKPHKICLYLETIFNRMLPIAFCWGLFDLFCTIGALSSDAPLFIKFTIFPFMALHLMPVWLYLGGVISAILSYKNLSYVITDKALYISAGAFNQVFERREIREIRNITLRKGFWDNILFLGDINITFRRNDKNATLTRNGFPLHNIYDYQEVYELLNKLLKEGLEEKNEQNRTF